MQHAIQNKGHNLLNNDVISLHDNVTSHSTHTTQRFVLLCCMSKVLWLESEGEGGGNHPPYSSDLPPPKWLSFFLILKLILNHFFVFLIITYGNFHIFTVIKMLNHSTFMTMKKCKMRNILANLIGGNLLWCGYTKNCFLIW